MNKQVWQQAISGVKNIFSESLVEAIARESKFIQRNTGRVSPTGLLFALTVSISQNALSSLNEICEIISTFNGLKVSSQALSQRLGSHYTVRFLQRCLAHLLREKSRSGTARLRFDGILNCFSNIYIEDSTSCKLHQHASKDFRGLGGSASSAGYKLHSIWNASTSVFTSFLIGPVAIPDQSMCRHILNYVKSGDLVLRDLGYFSLFCFQEIAEKNAYFLSRLKPGVKVYTPEGELIQDLGKYLDKTTKSIKQFYQWLYIGANKRNKVRLIALKVPESVYNKRMRKQKRVSQRRGTTPSKGAKALAKFTVLITNIPESKVSSEQVTVLYGFRWQIELLFKSFKSHLHIDLIKGKSKERIECYIIAKLISIVAITHVFSELEQYVRAFHRLELSYYKFVGASVANKLLQVMFSEEKLFHTEVQIENMCMVGLCKQKRKRRTTLGLLQDGASIWEKFKENPFEAPDPVAA